MLSRKKIRTIFLIFAVAIELMIGLVSAVYLKMNSLSFLLVMLTALIAIGSIVYFVLHHGTDVMK